MNVTDLLLEGGSENLVLDNITLMFMSQFILSVLSAIIYLQILLCTDKTVFISSVWMTRSEFS